MCIQSILRLLCRGTPEFESVSIGELQISPPLKSSHFQNCSVLLESFLVCSTSDQVTADAFGNHLGQMRVFNEENISFHWRSVFVQFFCEFVEVILTAH
jgi:hypothetical protein